jgi:hypothetical protein
MLEREYASISKIIDAQKLSTRRAGAPHGYRRCARHFRFMESPDQCCRNMAVLGMIIVTWAVEISRHQGDKVCAILAVIGFNEL